jgi:ABC-2 type transport system permease protein
VAAFAALFRAGFRRFSTYRMATWAAIFTNSVFGFLRSYVLLAALGASAAVAGYGRDQLLMFVWAGQGIIGVVLLWGWNELADRVRTGDVAADLLRPVDPLWAFLAADLGRAAHAVTTRLVAPLAVGAIAFGLYVPRRLETYPLFAVSLVLAVVVSFGLRYLVNLATFWFLDIRGFSMALAVGSATFTGLALPVTFFPGWLQAAVWATPFPAMLQIPLDVLCERVSPAAGYGLVAAQGGWAAALLATAYAVQRRGVRRLVVQGG